MSSCGRVSRGAGAEIRTRTPLRAAEFKSAASAVPPLRRASRVAERDATTSDDQGAVDAKRRAGQVSVVRTTSPTPVPDWTTTAPSADQIPERPAVSVYPPPVGPAKLANATQTS